MQESYKARPIRFVELWEVSGWKLKVYEIAFQRQRPRPELVRAAKEVVRQRVSSVTAGQGN